MTNSRGVMDEDSDDFYHSLLSVLFGSVFDLLLLAVVLDKTKFFFILICFGIKQ